MAWIETVAVERATGRLKKIYEAAIRRAGKVFQIVQVMSLDPALLDSSMVFYQRVMFAKGGIGRRRREMLAVVVSRENDCHY